MPEFAANPTRLFAQAPFLERFARARKTQVTESLQRLAALVECRNAGDTNCRPRSPHFDRRIAFQAAVRLVFKGDMQPNGRTKFIRPARRREAKSGGSTDVQT
jgi:malate synthase